MLAATPRRLTVGVLDVGQRAVRIKLIGGPVEHACAAAPGVRVARDLR